ncbi:hypothetical protein THJ046_08940 [Campylobacter jejuni]|nr:hypothetical protein THJ096_15980 [Campylobacter jejuni]GKY12494.1 hypothetical protein THJ046_08940 [Campylobacter jejuni]GKY14295.1 hypothetical protein THJ049_09780 [Campylobacter jejuni]
MLLENLFQSEIKLMKILSHRGYWKNKQEKNSITAFDRSFLNSYGLETDLRDMGGGYSHIT